MTTFFVRAVLLAALTMGPLAAMAGAAARPLVADLSSPEISISTGFAGTELLLFGAIDRAGDVIVVVRGPRRTEIVRRKARIAGIWVNRDSLAFAGVPAFYWVAGTRPIAELAPPQVLASREIGAGNLKFRAVDAAAADFAGFREAFLRNKRRAALYGGGPLVRLIDDRLFRTTVRFPSTVPTGRYLVTVFLLRDGAVTATHTANLNIRKSGLEADIYNFAHNNGALYGIICVVIALFAGWIAGVVFRRS